MLLTLNQRDDGYRMAHIMHAAGLHLFDDVHGARLHIAWSDSAQRTQAHLELRGDQWHRDKDADGHRYASHPATHWPILAMTIVRKSPEPYAPRIAALFFRWNDAVEIERARADAHGLSEEFFVGALLHLCTSRCEHEDPPMQYRWHTKHDEFPRTPTDAQLVLLVARRNDARRQKVSRIVSALPANCGDYSFDALWEAAGNP